jgi:hypothetical protein
MRKALDLIFSTKKITGLGMVVHIHNPSYLGGGDWGDYWSR